MESRSLHPKQSSQSNETTREEVSKKAKSAKKEESGL